MKEREQLQPRRSIMRMLVALVAVIAGLAITSSTAYAADSSACGNIDVSTGATCSALVETDCTTNCVPLSFELSCDGECSGSCTETATTECTQECSSWCNTECEVDPGSFSCETSCSENCEETCPGKCHDHPSQGHCEASCRTRCDTDCTTSCTEIAPTETCTTKCGTCCDTSCTVQRNVECEVACDIDCYASLQGGCEIQCADPHGAIFCDGQFIETSGDPQECVDYLQSIQVGVDISAWASLGDDTKLGISCATMQSNASGTTAALFGLALLLLIALRRRSLCNS